MKALTYIEVPSAVVQIEGLPAEAEVRLKCVYGRVVGFDATCGKYVWHGDAEFDSQRGYVVTNVRKMDAGFFTRLARAIFA
jgi:hypothetical protein